MLSPAGLKFSLGEGPKKAFGEKSRLPGTRMGAAFVVRKALLDAAEYSRKWKEHEAGGAKARAVAAGAKGSLVVISARNQLRGVVEEVRGDGLLVQVRLRIGDQRLTAVITRDAVAELKLRRGDEAVAVIKSTEVMIGRSR